MLKATHLEGGTTAFFLSGIVVFLNYPFSNVNYLYCGIILILMFSCCKFGSVMADCDQNEKAMPIRDLLGYTIHCIVKRLDKNHRSIITHCITTPIIFFLLPALYLRQHHFIINDKSCIVIINFLVYVILVSLFFGNMMHIILDKFTVEGSYKWYAVFVLLWCIIFRKNINKYRGMLKTVLISKKSNFVLMYKPPFCTVTKVKDHGKTGGQYEAICRTNLQVFNYFCLSLLLLISVRPDIGRVLKICKDFIFNAIN